MSTKAQAILDEIRALPPQEFQAVWQQIQRWGSSQGAVTFSRIGAEPVSKPAHSFSTSGVKALTRGSIMARIGGLSYAQGWV